MAIDGENIRVVPIGQMSESFQNNQFGTPILTFPSAKEIYFNRIEQGKVETGVTVPDNVSSRLAREVMEENGGCIPYSTFMKIALTGNDGYYSAAKVKIGEKGDFITSPEESGLFGAALADLTGKIWRQMGSPESFKIIEMGAGHGKLALGFLDYLKSADPAFYSALQYIILEYGSLVNSQRQTLESFKEKVQYVKGSAYDLPFRGIKGVFISNELVDAFPVEIVTRTGGQIKQMFVAIENGKWVELWKEPNPDVLAFIEKYGITLKEDVEEPLNILSAKFQHELDSALSEGAILTIDYGSKGTVGDINFPPLLFFRSFANGNRLSGWSYYDEPLPESGYSHHSPEYNHYGETDITARVNFEVLEKVAEADGLDVAFFGTQKTLLGNSNFPQITEHYRQEQISTSSWREIWQLAGWLHGADNVFRGRYGRFCGQILTKGINPPNIKDKELPDQEYVGKFRSADNMGLKIGKPYQAVYGRYGDLSNEFTVMQILDGNGLYPLSNLYPDTKRYYRYSKGYYYLLRLYDQNGNILLDFSDPESLQQAVENSGYIYDL